MVRKMKRTITDVIIMESAEKYFNKVHSNSATEKDRAVWEELKKILKKASLWDEFIMIQKKEIAAIEKELKELNALQNELLGEIILEMGALFAKPR